MLRNSRYLALIVVLLLLKLMTGCSSVSTIEARLHAHEALNPDINGRPSPLAVRFYELKSLSVFNTADFFNLFEQDVALLGDELQMRDEFAFQPGETKRLQRDLRIDTRYLGIVGAYRDIENARWRHSVEVEPGEDLELVIEFGAKGIDIRKEE
ncbi:MAG: type VI secretion system lipoprotein TssJ [Chromatiales bacterium]|jgi:type VI secretion system protein VasD